MPYARKSEPCVRKRVDLVRAERDVRAERGAPDRRRAGQSGAERARTRAPPDSSSARGPMTWLVRFALSSRPGTLSGERVAEGDADRHRPRGTARVVGAHHRVRHANRRAERDRMTVAVDRARSGRRLDARRRLRLGIRRLRGGLRLRLRTANGDARPAGAPRWRSPPVERGGRSSRRCPPALRRAAPRARATPGGPSSSGRPRARRDRWCTPPPPYRRPTSRADGRCARRAR